MSTVPNKEEAGLQTSFLFLRRSVLGALLLACIVACTWVLFEYGATEWSVARRIVGGIFLGALSFLSLFINRVLIST